VDRRRLELSRHAIDAQAHRVDGGRALLNPRRPRPRPAHVGRVQALRARLLPHRHRGLGMALELARRAGPRPRSSSTPAIICRAPTSSRSSPGCCTPTRSAASTSTIASTPTTTSPSAPSTRIRSSASSTRSSSCPDAKAPAASPNDRPEPPTSRARSRPMVQTVVMAQELFAKAPRWWTRKSSRRCSSPAISSPRRRPSAPPSGPMSVPPSKNGVKPASFPSSLCRR